MTNNFVYDIRAVLNIRTRFNLDKEFDILPLETSCITDFSKFRTGYVDITTSSSHTNISHHFTYGKDELDTIFDSCPVNGGVTCCYSDNGTITVGFDCLHAKDILVGGRSEEFVLEECAKLISWLKEKQQEFENLQIDTITKNFTL
jgi:hypothetical protein